MSYAARRIAPALLLLAACGSDGDVDAKLAARRAALGLADEPIPFDEAMREMGEKGYEGALVRLGAKGLVPDAALAMALDIENLLMRADLATAGARPPSPLAFDARMKEARERALALARALGRGGEGAAEAGDLVAACFKCHDTFRKPR